MCARICRRVLLVSAGIILSLAGTSASVTVVNYDNHPDLEKAKLYDLTVENEKFMRPDGTFDHELYKSYMAGGNRELAEQHYLAYLQDVNDSFQRAAVYARLGYLFCGIADQRVGLPINRDKARTYYRKALEAEPERIGMATLQARGFFATDGNTDEERFASYMDYYQWLLSIDEQTLKEKALPNRPPRPPATHELDGRRQKLRAEFEAKRPPRPLTSGGGLLGFIRDQAEATARNLVREAQGRVAVDLQTRRWSQARAVQHLIILAERFPGTSAAERANEELARIASSALQARAIYLRGP